MLEEEYMVELYKAEALMWEEYKEVVSHRQPL